MIEDIIAKAQRRPDIQEDCRKLLDFQANNLEGALLSDKGYLEGSLVSVASHHTPSNGPVKRLFHEIVTLKKLETVLEAYKKLDNKPPIDIYTRDFDMQTGELALFNGSGIKLWKHWRSRMSYKYEFADWFFTNCPDDIREWHAHKFTEKNKHNEKHWREIYLTGYLRQVMDPTDVVSLEDFCKKYNPLTGQRLSSPSRKSLYGLWYGSYKAFTRDFKEWLLEGIEDTIKQKILHYDRSMLVVVRPSANQRTAKTGYAALRTNQERAAYILKKFTEFKPSCTLQDFTCYYSPETGQQMDDGPAHKLYMSWLQTEEQQDVPFDTYLKRLSKERPSAISQRIAPKDFNRAPYPSALWENSSG